MRKLILIALIIGITSDVYGQWGPTAAQRAAAQRARVAAQRRAAEIEKRNKLVYEFFYQSESARASVLTTADRQLDDWTKKFETLKNIDAPQEEIDMAGRFAQHFQDQLKLVVCR